MDRRHFLSTSLFAVTAATGRTTDAAAAARTAPAAPAPAVAFSEAQFRRLLGSSFRFAGDTWRGPLTLTDVVSRPTDARLEQFTAVFKTDGTAAPEAGVYEVAHPDTGRFTLRIDGHRASDVRLATFALLRG